MSEPIGKILLIDDKFDDTIKDAIAAIAKAGISVQFWDSKGDFPSTISNVRVVIADEDIGNVGIKTKTAGYYSLLIEVLRKVPGPFFVILMAREYEEGDSTIVRNFYKELHPDSPLCGVILDKGLRKDEELDDPSKIVQIINESVKSEKILRLILAWEAVIDKAQDRAFSELISNEVKDTLFHLVKSLSRDFGEESVSREFVDNTTQLISRRIHDTPEFRHLESIIKELNTEDIDNQSYPRDQDLFLYNKLMYFKPKTQEDLWTGDIFRTGRPSDCEKYAIILTPVCDLVNSDRSKFLVCLGFSLDEKDFQNPKHPLFELDPSAAKKLKNVNGDATKTNYLKNKYMKCTEGKILDNFYLLWNFTDNGVIFGLCFDFNNVMTIPSNNIDKSNRVLRLDWPFIQEVQEKYGRYISRVGVPEINLSREKLREKFEAHQNLNGKNNQQSVPELAVVKPIDVDALQKPAPEVNDKKPASS